MKADRPTSGSVPPVVEAFDRLLLAFSSVGLVAIVLGLSNDARAADLWILAVQALFLSVCVVVALCRGRLVAGRRSAAYSLCFAATAGAEVFRSGLSGNTLLLAFLAVLLASVTPGGRVRQGVYVFVGLVLGGVAAGQAVHWSALERIPASGTGSLALFGFACAVVVYWRHLGLRLHRADERVRVAEDHFRSLFELSGDAGLLLEGGRVIEANAQARAMFGYSAEELLGLSPADVSPELQANGKSSAEETRLLAAEALVEPQHFRWMYRRKDGRLFDAEVSLSSSLQDGRRVYIAIVRDLSDYRLIERENRLLATALNHAGEAVVITDAAGHFVYVNRAFEAITGYSRHEVHGRTPSMLKSGRHDAAFYGELWSTISSGRAWRGRIQNRRKDGQIYTENSCITPLRDDRGTISHYVAVKRDISHELELEEQLVQSRKMEAVGRLAGGIAHDFNNILQVITGNVAMAGMDAPAGHPVHGSLDEIARAGERAVNLVQQLLAFSRREELRLRPVEIGALVADTARMLRRLIGEDIALEIKPPTEPLTVLADPGRIEQVLLNLCVNARDAQPDGGRITIEMEHMELDEDFCRIHPEARPGPQVVVAVSDEGSGIPKEFQHRIFEPFFSTKEVGRGTGLGLATVYAIVRQHGGFIHLYSEVGLGTTFRFYLPAVPATAATETVEPVPDLTSLHGRGETILIAEDDEQVLAIANRVLVQSGYRVLLARHGDEALALHESHEGPIHLAILDVVMPRRNGRLTHDALRRRDPELPVLFATGYSYHHLQNGLVERVQVLRKPFTPRELLTRVRTLLDERSGAAPTTNN